MKTVEKTQSREGSQQKVKTAPVATTRAEALKKDFKRGDILRCSGASVPLDTPFWKKSEGCKIRSYKKDLEDNGGVLLLHLGYKITAYTFIGGNLYSLSDCVSYAGFLDRYLPDFR